MFTVSTLWLMTIKQCCRQVGNSNDSNWSRYFDEKTHRCDLSQGAHFSRGTMWCDTSREHRSRLQQSHCYYCHWGLNDTFAAYIRSSRDSQPDWLRQCTDDVGWTGASGLHGATGQPGETGLPGIDGATGPTGPVGATGSTGLRGISGATGYTGRRRVSSAELSHSLFSFMLTAPFDC